MNITLPETAQDVVAQPSMVDAAFFNWMVNLAYMMTCLFVLWGFLKVLNRLNTGTWNSFKIIKEDPIALTINRAAWIVGGALVLAFS